MHRTKTFAATLLLGSALVACPEAAAQAQPVDQAAAAGEAPPDTVQPSASVTLVQPSATAPVQAAAGEPVPATAPATLPVVGQAPGVAQPPGTITATTTLIDVPAAVAVTPTGTTTSATVVVPATATAGATVPAATDQVIDPATYQKRTEFDNTPWRFNMEQNGKRMTADEFTAWMEARGVRVAKGAKPHAPANRTSDGMPAPGSARPGGVATPGGAGQAVVATASTTLVVPVPAAPGEALQPGSVTPTDAWTGTEPAAQPTTSATLVVPVVEEAPLPAEDGEAR